MTVELTSELAALMLEKVRNDRQLSVGTRTRALRQASDVSQPARSLSRLQTIAAAALPLEPRLEPTVSLSRTVAAATFWKYHAQAQVRETFITADDFIRYVNTSEGPSGVVFDMLADDPVVFSWERSWLSSTVGIRGMRADEIIAALEMGSAVEPPVVVFDLPLSLLRQHGVTVRRPNSLDSVLGPNPQWSPSGLASGVEEFVDGDVPRAVVAAVRWVR